jgi:hypothetical protein
MRPILIAIATAALMSASAAPTHAQLSFYNKRFCAVPGGPNSGSEPDCSYNTWEQCRLSLSGTRYCSENPYWRPEPHAARRRGPSREY